MFGFVGRRLERASEFCFSGNVVGCFKRFESV